jgi:hypothetical protein
MQPASILRRTLILTSWLLGISVVWVVLLSVVGVTVAGRAFSAGPDAFGARRMARPGDDSVTTGAAAADRPDELAADGNAAGHGSAHHVTARAPRQNR